MRSDVAQDVLLFLCLVAPRGVVWSTDQSSAASWTSFSLQASASPWDLDKPWKDRQHSKASWSPSWNSHHSEEWQPKHVNYPSPDIEIHVRAKPHTSYGKSISYHKPVSYSKKPAHTVSPYSHHKSYDKPNYIPWVASPPLVKEKISPEEALWYPNDMPLELIRQNYKWGSQEFDEKFSKKIEDHTYPKHLPYYEPKPYEPKPVGIYKPKPIISYEPKPVPPKASPPLYEPIPTPLYYHETSTPPQDKPLVVTEDKAIIAFEPEYDPLADPNPATIYEPEPDPTPAPTLAPTPEPTPAPTVAPTYAPTTPPAPPPTTLPTLPPSPPPTTTIPPATVYTITDPPKTTKESITYKSEPHEAYEPEPYPPYHPPYLSNPYPNLPSYAPLDSPRNYYLSGNPEPTKPTYKGPGKLIRNYYLNKDLQSGDISEPEARDPYQPPVYPPTYFHPSPYGGHADSSPIYDPGYSPYDQTGYEPLPQYPPLPSLPIRSYYLGGTSKPTHPTTAAAAAADTEGAEDRVGDLSKRSSAYGYDVIQHQRSSRNKWPFS